jgi:hypothetical protein
MKTFSMRITAVLLVLVCCSVAHSQTISVGTPQTVLTPGARPDGMLDFPDSPLGVKKIGGLYYIFADSGYVPASGHSGIQGMTSPDMNSLSTNYTIYTPTTNLSLGGANDFDRDYVGGGATIYDAVNNNIIILYHGEYHWVEGQPHFTGGLGLAVSHDLGLTWTKLGVVLLPNYNWSTCTGTADPAGLDIGDGDLNMRSDGYTYFYYNEKAGSCMSSAVYNGVARANTAALIAAAVAGVQPSGSLFQKYSGGSFSTPGVINTSNQALGGGASDNISPSLFMYDPVVRFDSFINKYIMTYIVPWTGLSIAFSTDGMTWTNPTTILTGGTTPSGTNAFVYGTPVNTDGGDPDVLGSSFWVYYENPYGDWSSTNLARVLVTITSGGVASPNPPSTLKAVAH